MDFRGFMMNVSKIKTGSETKMCRNGKCVCIKNGKRVPCRKIKNFNKTFKKKKFFNVFKLPLFKKSKKRRKINIDEIYE